MVEMGYSIFYPYRGMEDNFLNFLFGLEFQGVVAKMAERRQFSRYDATGRMYDQNF